MAGAWWRTGWEEQRRSWSRRAFVSAAQRLVPAVEAADLVPCASGVRAQAVAADGALVDDFVIRAAGRALHIYNAPSPAATASLAIGEAIAQQLDLS